MEPLPCGQETHDTREGSLFASRSVWDAGWPHLGLRGSHLWLNSLGLAKEAERPGMRLDCGSPIQMLTSGIAQWASGAP